MTEAERRAWVLAALDEHEVRLVRYALRLLGDEDLARDCVQHAFLKLCDEARRTNEGYEGGRLAAWLFRVCRNRAVDHLRQQGRERALSFCDADEEELTKPSSRDADPAEAASDRDLAECLKQLVDALPLSQREAIGLWCEGFAFREIGEIIGAKEGNVRVLVHRGLTRLRQYPQVRAWLAAEVGQASSLPKVRVHS